MARGTRVTCDECKEQTFVREGETLEGWLAIVPAVGPVDDKDKQHFCRPECLITYFERKRDIAAREARRSRREAAQGRPIL